MYYDDHIVDLVREMLLITLKIAAPEDYLRAFLDEGDALLRLLPGLRHRLHLRRERRRPEGIDGLVEQQKQVWKARGELVGTEFTG